MTVTILPGDCREVLKTLPDESVDCCVTSPPYFGLRDYGHEGQIGLEQTPADFVAQMVGVFREIRRVLRKEGTLWLNLGDSYVMNPSTSKMPRSAQGNGSGALRLPDDGDMMERRMSGRANAATPLIRSGLKKKDLIGIPWRVAFALQDDGWYLRQDIIWSKPNPMPESVRDRCTKAHEYVFMLSKSPKYFYDQAAVAEPVTPSTIARMSQPNIDAQADSDRVPGKTNGAMKAVVKKQDGHGRRHAGFNDRYFGQEELSQTRNRRSVWSIATQPFSEAHFAVMAPELAETCIKAGCPIGGTVLDPFGGAGTTGLVADRLQRNAILIELNPEYADIARRRITSDASLFADVV